MADTAKRGTRIPENFLDRLYADKAQGDWFRENCPDVEPRIENQKFMNYWLAKTGRDATKHDWTRTWRNWMLKAQQDSRPRAGRPNRLQQNDHELANYLAKQDAEEQAAPTLRLVIEK